MNLISLKLAYGDGYRKEPHEMEVVVNFDLVTHIRKTKDGHARIYTDAHMIETRKDYDELINELSQNKDNNK